MAISENLFKQRSKFRRQADIQMEIFQRFLEISPQALAMANLEGRIFFANDSLCRLIGIGHPEDLYGEDLAVCLSAETAKRLHEEILPLVRQEGQWVGAPVWTHVSGSSITVMERISLVRSEDGQPLGFTAAITDLPQPMFMERERRARFSHIEDMVDERAAERDRANLLRYVHKDTREADEVEKSRLAAVMEKTTDLVAIATPDGRILYMNDAGRRMVGWGERKDDVLWERDLAEVHPVWALRVVKDFGIPTAIEEGVWLGETAILDSEGKEIPISQLIIAHRGDKGGVDYLSTIMRDISKFKQTEDALRESETYIRNIIDHAPFGAHSYRLLDDGRLIFLGANQSADRILHLDHSSLIGLTIEEAFPMLEKEIPGKYRDVARTGERWVKDVTYYQGGDITGSFAVFAFRTGPDRMTVFFYDITDRKKTEEALKESERLLKDSQRLTKVGGWEFDVEKQTMIWTDETYRIHDFDPTEFNPGTLEHAQRSLDCYPPEARLLVEEAYQRCVDQGVPYDLEVPFITANGRRLWIRTPAQPVWEDGKVVKIYGNIQDITDRKQAEERLRESEERFRGLTEAMTQHVWILDVKRNVFYHNPQSIEYTGFAAASAEDMWHIVHPEDQPLVKTKWHEMIPSGRLIEYTYRRRRHDGVYRWFLSRCVLMRDEQNQLQRIFGVDTDIDDFKRAQQALQDNLALLADAERMGHTGSWKADLDMKNLSVSEGIRRIYEIPDDEEILFETFIARIHPDDLEGMIEKWRSAIERKNAFTAEYRIVLSDGSVRHLFRNSEVIKDEKGRPIGFHGTVQDVTEKKMLEDEMIKAQKLESLGRLAGGLAHDYNNLLTTIMGSLELIKMSLDRTSRIYPTVLRAEEAVLSARDLTRQLITFSRGGHPMGRVMFVDKILKETVRLALKGAITKVEWKIAEALPRVNIDENQMSQVFYNIVTNAREAMAQEGKLVIEVDQTRLDRDNALRLKEGAYCRLVFRDQGPGIREALIPKLFDPYFSTKEMGNQKGMGLGLPICYSIMKKHNGHIQIESREGVGTTVTLMLPAALDGNH
jgi:PAS domain S-box-containing protein